MPVYSKEEHRVRLEEQTKAGPLPAFPTESDPILPPPSPFLCHTHCREAAQCEIHAQPHTLYKHQLTISGDTRREHKSA